jgi:hypothetical protein
VVRRLRTTRAPVSTGKLLGTRQSRAGRGRETELLARERWKRVFPHCQVVASSAPGRDLLNTAPFAPEIKARSEFNPVAWARQAARNAGDDIPVVVMRPNGFGPEQVDKWLVFLYQADFLELVKRAGLGGAGIPAGRADTERSREDPEGCFRFRLEFGANISSREVKQAVLSAVFRGLGFEPGHYEVEVFRSAG